ncbi:hypothetical protein [Lebetimonas sp. JH292]|nr:hypothetical protein [Lebetimonas sp. JH292]
MEKINSAVEKIEKDLNLPIYSPFNIKVLNKSQKNQLPKENKKL